MGFLRAACRWVVPFWKPSLPQLCLVIVAFRPFALLWELIGLGLRLPLAVCFQSDPYSLFPFPFLSDFFGNEQFLWFHFKSFVGYVRAVTRFLSSCAGAQRVCVAFHSPSQGDPWPPLLQWGPCSDPSFLPPGLGLHRHTFCFLACPQSHSPCYHPLAVSYLIRRLKGKGRGSYIYVSSFWRSLFFHAGPDFWFVSCSFWVGRFSKAVHLTSSWHF